MKSTMFATALGLTLSLGVTAGAGSAVRSVVVTTVASHGADDLRPDVQKPEVQKPQRPEKPGRDAITVVASHGADDVRPEVQKPQRPEKPGRA